MKSYIVITNFYAMEIFAEKKESALKLAELIFSGNFKIFEKNIFLLESIKSYLKTGKYLVSMERQNMNDILSFIWSEYQTIHGFSIAFNLTDEAARKYIFGIERITGTVNL